MLITDENGSQKKKRANTCANSEMKNAESTHTCYYILEFFPFEN
jgi:hypothetical protein